MDGIKNKLYSGRVLLNVTVHLVPTYNASGTVRSGCSPVV